MSMSGYTWFTAATGAAVTGGAVAAADADVTGMFVEAGQQDLEKLFELLGKGISTDKQKPTELSSTDTHSLTSYSQFYSQFLTHKCFINSAVPWLKTSKLLEKCS